MPLFECSTCGALENTALSNYWSDVMHDKKPALCSECDPEIGKWHGSFPKRNAKEAGFTIVDDSGFLHHPSESK